MADTVKGIAKLVVAGKRERVTDNPRTALALQTLMDIDQQFAAMRMGKIEIDFADDTFVVKIVQSEPKVSVRKWLQELFAGRD